MENIDIKKVKKQLPELIKKTAIIGEIIITKGGQPIAKIVGIPEKKKQRTFGAVKGLIKMSDDFDQPLKDFQEYMQ